MPPGKTALSVPDVSAKAALTGEIGNETYISSNILFPYCFLSLCRE
jgi:hypothetical protein